MSIKINRHIPLLTPSGLSSPQRQRKRGNRLERMRGREGAKEKEREEEGEGEGEMEGQRENEWERERVMDR